MHSRFAVSFEKEAAVAKIFIDEFDLPFSPQLMSIIKDSSLDKRQYPDFAVKLK
jgi:hypothetical protein